MPQFTHTQHNNDKRTVGSTRMVSPGWISPRFSASKIMDMAMRSLTLLAGFCDSNLQTTSAPVWSTTRFKRIKGVLPTRSRMLEAIFSADSAVKSRWGTAEGVEKALLPERKRASAQVVKLNFMVVVAVKGEAMKISREVE